MEYNLEELSDIFTRVRDTLIENSEYNLNEFNDDYYKNAKKEHLTDNDYYKILVYVAFYSGFRASTVGKHLPVINNYFPNYETVMFYDENMFIKIFNDRSMIRHEKKIRACINNAKKINEIIKHYGSFENYIDSFEPNKNDNNLLALKRNLEKFDFLGGITVYHFMKDIGLEVIKPDRVLMRIFKRLNLIYDEDYLFGAVKVGRLFSQANNLPIGYIDMIFVLYGQLNVPKIKCICSEKNPKCNICGAKMYCNYN